MAVTINDVAKEAGVSITTVSRVLNNNYPVKKETRIKIEKAIEKLEYKPNAMARSLITKKTSIIGVIVPGITNLFFPTIVEAIEDITKSRGYSISLGNTGGDAKEETKLVEELKARQVDGIIVIDPTIENLEKGCYDKLSKLVPLIVVNGAPSGNKCSFVCYDEEVGTIEAFEYLLQLGHKKIAFIRGHKSFSYDIKEKIYRITLKNEKLDYMKILNVGKGNSIEVVDRVESEIRELFLSDERPTAVFACNDLMAMGVINACSKLGIKVPEDLSVVGFDNTLISKLAHPKLTTVDLNMKEIGHRAALELIDIIENKTKSRKKVILGTKLIIRESCEEI
ncbi:LacI family transcriptional regulator [Clostridium sp. SYSU_GA19001]|uniref:LacI family DNA-binding transcriptional regulator n=1 Tax=Clostridium caldaquaticum TaxID=2940653 RepID=UPI00207723F3|nr:LacI family DNA-binding transcriptional regulator [Clostridium caldaquaticum]MCM8710091.1 LacI family transcriptional regulator [Clostridium caldaquaticum]